MKTLFKIAAVVVGVVVLTDIAIVVTALNM